MLPFPKRKATSEEVELTDDDLVLVEEIAPPGTATQPSSVSSPAHSHSHVRAASPHAAHADAPRVVRAPRAHAPTTSERAAHRELLARLKAPIWSAES